MLHFHVRDLDEVKSCSYTFHRWRSLLRPQSPAIQRRQYVRMITLLLFSYKSDIKEFFFLFFYFNAYIFQTGLHIIFLHLVKICFIECTMYAMWCGCIC